MNENSLKSMELWFVTGSQHLYGEAVLQLVDAHSREIVASLDADPMIPVRVVFKSVLTGPDAIRKLCAEANVTTNVPASSAGCIRFRRLRCGSVDFRC